MTYSAKRRTYAYSYTEAGKHAAGPHTGYEYREDGKAEQNLAADAQNDARR